MTKVEIKIKINDDSYQETLVRLDTIVLKLKEIKRLQDEIDKTNNKQLFERTPSEEIK